jgi:hypothetical protein
LYWGFVAACSRWNARSDATAISSPIGTDEIGSSHEKFSDGPSYSIWMMAVTVPFPLSAKMMRSAAWFTGCVAAQKNPPQASAGVEFERSADSAAAVSVSGFRRYFMIQAPSGFGASDSRPVT